MGRILCSEILELMKDPPSRMRVFVVWDNKQ